MTVRHGGPIDGLGDQPPYAGLVLDRAIDRRGDADWLASTVTESRARVLPFWRDRCLVAGDPPAPVVLSTAVAGGPSGADLVLLGIAAQGPQFALDLSTLPEAEVLARTSADAHADLRSLFGDLTAADAALLAYARGLLRWNRRQRFCGRCGTETDFSHAGLQRVCANPDCREVLFPRIEPAVITLVEAGTPPRCLMARHRSSTAGGYSLLAGFVEIGESLEDAVRRELYEEAGVIVEEIRYIGSQPWPFPAGLMIAFRAVAADAQVSVDGAELLEARWFTREDLRQYSERAGKLGRIDSIDRLMLAAWLSEEE